MEAMQAQTVDVIKRMKEITLVMQTPKQREISSMSLCPMRWVLQSETQPIKEKDNIKERKKEGLTGSELVDAGRQFLDLLCLRLEKGRNKEGPGKWFNSHANIRAKAAEVVSTIVQNNPRSQQLVMEANGLEPLLSNFTSDPDVTACTKALGAISCGHNKPAIAAFLLANGYATLRGALGSESLRFQREKGLVVLPGEDALPPDVASKHFEPPLRAWAANRNEDTKPSNEKKQAPLLIGLGPPVQNSSSGGMAGEENRDTST
ncbi:hypothetical protein BC332_23366 [Capsicum chinense]|nr:hypothetical protein BC332_23366 [Capsicum chinense]